MCAHLYVATFYIRIVLPCCSNGALSTAQASMSMMCPCLARSSTTSHLEVSGPSLPPSTPSAPEENLTRCGHKNRVCSVCNIHTYVRRYTAICVLHTSALNSMVLCMLDLVCACVCVSGGEPPYPAAMLAIFLLTQTSTDKVFETIIYTYLPLSCAHCHHHYRSNSQQQTAVTKLIMAALDQDRLLHDILAMAC